MVKMPNGLPLSGSTMTMEPTRFSDMAWTASRSGVSGVAVIGFLRIRAASWLWRDRVIFQYLMRA